MAKTQALLDEGVARMMALDSDTGDVVMEVRRGVTRPVWEPDQPGTMAMLALAQGIAGEIGFEMSGASAGGGSDGNFTGALGIPTLDSIGVRGRICTRSTSISSSTASWNARNSRPASSAGWAPDRQGPLGRAGRCARRKDRRRGTRSMTDITDPADLGALEARHLIGRRALSCTELAQACIARVEAVDKAVNALVARDFDRVLEAARVADGAVASGRPLGALHGLPVAIKDMNDVSGLPTTYGSEIFRDNVPEVDDALVAGLRSAGALPLGKTNNPEWSAGANTRNRVYGTTANPHDVTRNCGGSSGGSAVALACGYAPLASGSDLGGSLRTPAAYCGVVGFRPSAGVVPGPGRATALLPQPTSGPMARNVADCALMLSVMATPDRDDPYTPVVNGRTAWDPARFATLPPKNLSSVKVAITEDFGFAPVAPETRALFRTAMEQLAPAFGPVEERHPDCADADRIFSVLRSVMFLATHAPHVDATPDLVGPLVTDNVAEGRGYSAADVAEALVAQGAYHRRWRAFFDTCDVLIALAVAVQPRDWQEWYPTEIDGREMKSYYHWLAMAYAATIPGHPAIVLPCGSDADGLPFGIQVIGRRHGDADLLAVAAQIEAVIEGTGDLAPRRPDLRRLASGAGSGRDLA